MAPSTYEEHAQEALEHMARFLSINRGRSINEHDDAYERLKTFPGNTKTRALDSLLCQILNVAHDYATKECQRQTAPAA